VCAISSLTSTFAISSPDEFLSVFGNKTGFTDQDSTVFLVPFGSYFYYMSLMVPSINEAAGQHSR